MAALIVNAVASEPGASPADVLMNNFAGKVSFGTERGNLHRESAKLWNAGEILRSMAEESSGLAQASKKLDIGDHDGFLEELNKTALASSDPGRFAARVFLAEQARNKGQWEQALTFYLAVCDDGSAPSFSAFQGTLGALVCFIRSNQDQEALDLLKKAMVRFPEQQILWEQMQIFLLGRTGDYLELAKTWAAVKDKHVHAPERMIYEGLCKGGDAAAAAQISRSAERFYADAFNFAANDAERRNCLKKLILLQEKMAPEKALRSIERYLRFFPNAADAGKVRLLQGDILIRQEHFSEALELYREILTGKKYKVEERIQAAFRAAAVSEQNGNISVAREFYNSAIRRFADHPESANRVKMQLLEFLIRTREFSSAAMLGEELAGTPGVDLTRLNILRLKALSELKRYKEAALIARELSTSADPVCAAEGVWQLARLKEIQNEKKESKQLYLDFSKRFPKDKRVPEALLAVADFSIQEKDFKGAFLKLDEYLQKFPGHSGVKKAMSVAVFSLLHWEAAGNLEKAEKLLERLGLLFPVAKEYDEAALELIRYFCKHEEHASALKALDDFLKKRPSSPWAAEGLLLGGSVLEKMGELDKAVEYVDRLLDKYPNSSVAVEAAMLGGSCSFQKSNYQRALKYYERACELGGRGVMAQVAAGEAADCHLQLKKKENLAAAVKLYRGLAAKSEFPALRIQALCKLGIAYEFKNEPMKALEAYEEMLTLAVSSEKVRQSSGVALWCARGAHSALRIILSNPHLPDGSQRAQRLYRLYSLLDLPGSSGELSRYLEEIRKHYNLLD